MDELERGIYARGWNGGGRERSDDYRERGGTFYFSLYKLDARRELPYDERRVSICVCVCLWMREDRNLENGFSERLYVV